MTALPLPAAPMAGINPIIPSPIYDLMLMGSVVCRPYIGNPACYKFMSVTVMTCSQDIVTALLFTTQISCLLRLHFWSIPWVILASVGSSCLASHYCRLQAWNLGRTKAEFSLTTSCMTISGSTNAIQQRRNFQCFSAWYFCIQQLRGVLSSAMESYPTVLVGNQGQWLYTGYNL